MAEGMTLGKSWMMERGHGKWKVLVMFVFLCEHGSLEQRSGDMRARGGHVSPSLEGWEEVGSVRASGWMRTSSPLGCALAITIFCVSLISAFRFVWPLPFGRFIVTVRRLSFTVRPSTLKRSGYSFGGGGVFGVRWKEFGTAWAVGPRTVICVLRNRLLAVHSLHLLIVGCR